MITAKKLSPVAEEAARLFADGYRVVSRSGRIASRCPPDADPRELCFQAEQERRPADVRWLYRGQDQRWAHALGHAAADFYRRIFSTEKVTVSDAVMRELVRLAHEADEREREGWRSRLTFAHEPGSRWGREDWRAELEGVVVVRGRSKKHARDRALDRLLGLGLRSDAAAELLVARLGQPLAATPPPSPPAS